MTDPHRFSLPHAVSRLLLVGLALSLAACGRMAAAAPSALPADPAFQALVAGPPDPEGNATTTRYDSATRRTETLAAPGNASAVRFRGSRISYLVADSIQSQDPAGGGQRTEATDRRLLIAGYAWSRHGALAYLAQAPDTGSGGAAELVIRRPGHSRVTVPLAAAAGVRDGEAPQLQFSPDGSLLLLVDPLATGTPQPVLQVRRLDGRLVFGPGARPSDATWGRGQKLYFQDARGVNVADFRSGTTTTILPGVRWYRPDTAPDGRAVVFETRDGRGLPRFELLDTATDTVVARFERDGATLARFVSPGEIWFHPVTGTAEPQVRNEIVSLDTVRLTERPTGLTGYLSDVRLSASR